MNPAVQQALDQYTAAAQDLAAKESAVADSKTALNASADALIAAINASRPTV